MHIVHSQDWWFAYINCYLIELINVNMSIHLTLFFSEKPMGRVKFRVVQYIERWMLRGFDTVIHVSSEEAEFSENYRLVRQDKIRIVPNGLPDIIPNLSFKDNNLIVMVGRVDKQKNPERFIAIANSVHAIIPSIKFLYIGGGELLPKLQDECSKLSFVDFVGPQDGVQAFLEKASLFMSTSLYEGLPFAVIEAMRAGLPVALSKVTGHAELVDGDGILFRLSDSDQKIADRIANLMNDSENLQLMGEKSRDLFLKKIHIFNYGRQNSRYLPNFVNVEELSLLEGIPIASRRVN
ncbi:glycosyltransferase family 4 protein [Lactiplantibacillus plantarum]|nr:glycosyltransferase family 4 protein [Lactiplantibacillus plantarum]